MELTQVIECSREALRMALLLGGPLLAVALVMGLLVGMVQTLTQLQEPVVGLVPRLVAVLVAALAILPWLLGRWVMFAASLIESIPDHL
jgi:flagellar biosynthesis protein FliQ